MPNFIAGPAPYLLERQAPFRERGAVGPFDLQPFVQDDHVLGDVVEDIVPDIGAGGLIRFFYFMFFHNAGVSQ